ncbi:MAG: ATPase [Eubacterium sp.]|nr:ATPase [Eubacterium sp.]
MTVLDLLDELEDIVDTAPNVPLTGKIMVESSEVLEIVDDIRKALPEDVKQAKWLKDEKERILAEAKEEYEKIIMEAKKQAGFLVDNNDITLKAKKRADSISDAADDYSRVLKMKTYDYLDKMLYDMQDKVDTLNVNYASQMYEYLEKSFEEINSELQKNRDELKEMAIRTKNGEDWLYDEKDQEQSGEAAQPEEEKK